MNDLTILHDAWDAPAAPTPAAREAARTALLARGRAPAPERRRRLTVRRLSLAGLAAAIVVGAVAHDLVGTGGGGSGVPEASAAQVLQRAAVAARQRPFTAPRDDQWLYTEDRLTGSEGGKPLISREWRRADGGGLAMIDEHGKLVVEMARPPTHPARKAAQRFDSYKGAATLPTDPDALLRWAYAQTPNITGAGSTRHAEAYAILRGILRGNGVLPPAVEASVFGAMKRIPGVTLDTIHVLGRPTLALGLTDQHLRQELLLDAKTLAYAGQRSTVIEDAVISPEKAGNATGEIEKGSTVVAARVAAGIVDTPGQRP